MPSSLAGPPLNPKLYHPLTHLKSSGRIEVSRALGDRQFKRAGMSAVPDIQAFSLTSRDRFLLLACDGFWGARAQHVSACASLCLA